MKSSTDRPAPACEWLPGELGSLPEAGKSDSPGESGQEGFGAWMPSSNPFMADSGQDPVGSATAAHASVGGPHGEGIKSWLPPTFPSATFSAGSGGAASGSSVSNPLQPDDPAWSLFHGGQAVIYQEDIERQARLESERLLAEAQQQAGEILSRARLEAERARLQAYQEGLEAGRAEIAGLLAMAGQIVAETREYQEALVKNSEVYLLGLVRDTAQKLFGPGFALDPLVLGKTFESALSEAKALGDLRIRAHPEDVAALGPLWPAQQTALRGQQIELVPDQDIRRGGFTIEGQFGSIDGRLETQLGMIFETMNGVVSGAQAHSTPFVPGRALTGQEQP